MHSSDERLIDRAETQVYNPSMAWVYLGIVVVKSVVRLTDAAIDHLKYRERAGK
jgi:hypothetical protein